MYGASWNEFYSLHRVSMLNEDTLNDDWMELDPYNQGVILI